MCIYGKGLANVVVGLILTMVVVTAAGAVIYWLRQYLMQMPTGIGKTPNIAAFVVGNDLVIVNNDLKNYNIVLIARNGTICNNIAICNISNIEGERIVVSGNSTFTCSNIRSVCDAGWILTEGFLIPTKRVG
ncbi:hypothetical protein QPL79_02495 [Ignisphaera sp. 4213-co]|uniref:Uncharacterized protein n=1 Tax=Ignisphaera cupida TaxID=3050454 RepID=A0ABD4Z655_9CREN|nr:hypothetical protein [Ignisphaera sp. 4213-co]MDK6028234.1 hypothetical protein [Ignisphaera sp. 4213-co]